MASGQKHVLVVEDDASLSGWIADYLSDHGFLVSVANRGDEALELIRTDTPDLVLLDVMLPGLNGFDVCKQARAFYSGPILIITAGSEETDEVLGLELGADDFLGKPLKPRILLARMNALFRRGVDQDQDRSLVFGPVRLDANSRTVFYKDQALKISVHEFDVLWLLASNPGRVVSRQELIMQLRGFEYDGFDRSMDARISRLRRKLDCYPEPTLLIKTVRGQGYLFSVPAASPDVSIPAYS